MFAPWYLDVLVRVLNSLTRSVRCVEFPIKEKRMPAVTLKNMDVEALLTLRADVEKALTERSRALQRQLALLGVDVGKKRGRPAGRPGRVSAMKGRKVAPKYRGPGGETWAGRGATPRWLAALLKEGHSIEEFSIGAGRKAKSSVTKKPGRKNKPRKPTARASRRGRKIEGNQPAAAD
jgi:DNA-binding protein H-NS